MKTLSTLTIVLTICYKTFAFIPQTDFILQKSVSAIGRQPLTVEQDVYFKNGPHELAVHETWQIEGDKNLKLTATGLGDLKDSFRYVAIYNSKNRTVLVGKNKVTEAFSREFFEKYLSIRSVDSFKNYLTELTIQPLIRLSRANGATAFAIGEASAENLKPQIWIKQDTYEIQKIRLPSEVEITFDDFAPTPAKNTYPKTKKISWAGKQVVIKVRSINDKFKIQPQLFYPQNLETPSEVQLSNKNSAALIVEEFYKRFR